MVEFASVWGVEIAKQVYHYNLRLMPWFATEEQRSDQEQE
jgi:hypothetical protein